MHHRGARAGIEMHTTRLRWSSRDAAGRRATTKFIWFHSANMFLSARLFSFAAGLTDKSATSRGHFARAASGRRHKARGFHLLRVYLSQTKSGNLQHKARRYLSTFPTMVGTETAALTRNTCSKRACGPSKTRAGFLAGHQYWCDRFDRSSTGGSSRQFRARFEPSWSLLMRSRT